MVYMEATLKGSNKPDLIKLVLQLESEMNSYIKELTSEIRDLVTQMKKSWGCCYSQKCEREAS